MWPPTVLSCSSGGLLGRWCLSTFAAGAWLLMAEAEPLEESRPYTELMLSLLRCMDLCITELLGSWMKDRSWDEFGSSCLWAVTGSMERSIKADALWSGSCKG